MADQGLNLLSTGSSDTVITNFDFLARLVEVGYLFILLESLVIAKSSVSKDMGNQMEYIIINLFLSVTRVNIQTSGCGYMNDFRH